MLQRRLGAIAIVIAVIAILFFGTRAYLASQNTQALKNYDSEVASLLEGEQTQISQPLFSNLANAPGTAGGSLEELQDNIFQDYVTAREDAQQAAAWSVPSAVAGAQHDLLLVLDMRAEAIRQISQEIKGALNAGSLAAVRKIAGAMQILNAADVVYAVRVRPLIEQALINDGIAVAAGGVNLGGEQVVTSQFLPDQSWTIAGYVEGKILGATTPQLGGTLGAGTHGHQIVSVMAGSTLLSGSGINSVPYTSGLQFTVTFKNDGENDEFGVKTELTLSSASTQELTASSANRETEPGGTYTPTLAFATQPPFDTALLLTATVEPVNGETDTTNNTLKYYVEFKRS